MQWCNRNSTIVSSIVFKFNELFLFSFYFLVNLKIEETLKLRGEGVVNARRHDFFRESTGIFEIARENRKGGERRFGS